MLIELLDLTNVFFIQRLFEIRSDPKIDEMLSGSPPQNYECHKNWLSKEIESRKIFLIQEEDQIVGFCQIFNITNSSLELGWAIDPLYQGKGYGKKYVKILIDEALTFNKEIFLNVKKKNVKAIEIYKKNNFVEISEEDNLIKMKYRG